MSGFVRDIPLLGMMFACIFVFGPVATSAQPADTIITAAVSLARFEDARDLAMDPGGNLYVADAGADVVQKFGFDGTLLFTLGGPGSEEGQFDEPSGIDPTNGLILVVADAGNGRLKRFSREFHFLESVPLGSYEMGGTGEQATYLARQGEVLAHGDGRPIAVVTSEGDETFAVDEDRRMVVKWDRTRRFERTIGEEGELIRPVSLALADRLLFVADAGANAVVVFDEFGGYLRTLADGRAVEVQSVSAGNHVLWVVLPHRILVYQTAGRLERVLDVQLDELLVDSVFRGSVLYFLTATHLWSTEIR